MQTTSSKPKSSAEESKTKPMQYTRAQKELYKKVVAKNDQETVEDFEIAMELLNKY
jgi:hypothetical protein